MNARHPRNLLGTALVTALLGAGAFASVDAKAQDAPCSLTLSQNNVDFGTLDRATVRTRAGTSVLGEKSLRLLMSCPTPTDLTIFYQALATAADRFVLAEHASYAIEATNAQVDGATVDLGRIRTLGEVPDHIAPQLTWLPAQALVPMRGGLPAKGKSLSMNLKLTATAEPAAFQLSDAIRMQAQGAFTSADQQLSADLGIQAAVTPVACTVTLGNAGNIDVGVITVNSLNATRPTALPAKSVPFTVSCAAAARLRFQLIDNRAGTGTTNDSNAYGLGRDAAGNSIGSYKAQISTSSVIADGVTRGLYAMSSDSSGSTWTVLNPFATAYLAKTSYLGFARSGSIVPDEFRSISGDIFVETTIAPTNNLDTSGNIAIDGFSTLEVTYL